MALISPIRGIEPESSAFSKTATLDAPRNSTIISPIPGSVTEFDPNNKTIVIKSPEQSEVKFEKVGSFTAGLSVGSNISIGSPIGYTGNDKLEFTAFNKKGTKINAVDFIKNTDPTTLVAGGITPKGDDNTKSITSKSYKPSVPQKDIKDYALTKIVTGLGLLSQKLMGKAFNVAESEEQKDNLIKEEIERIKNLMK
jgi:hypothetical protein